jgi:rare lipoprotein A
MPVNVRITNLENGASLIVRVNDRGPFAKGRIIDVSAHAAQLLGFYAKGTAKVRVTYLSRADLPGGVEAPPLIAAAPTTTIQTAALNPVDSTPAPTEATPLHPYEAPPAESAQPAAAPANEAPPPDAAAEAPPAADEPSPGATAITELPPPPAKTSSLPPPPTEAVLGTQPTGKVTEVAVPAVTHLYVQAGAFLQRQNAERQRAKYAAAGGLTISPIDRGNHRLYRVRIGPFDDVGAADAALARLTGLGSDDARIVVDR